MFIALEAIAVLIPSTTLPVWADEFLLAIAIIGLPIAVIAAWAFELTPDGVRVTKVADGHPVATENKSQSVLGFIVTAGVVAAAMLLWWQHGDSGTETVQDPERTIAVLPFETLGAQQASAFTEGIHLGILTRLSGVSQLDVISRTSVHTYRESTKSLPEIADELGVAWVLRAEVQEVGDNVQIHARLLDARQDRQVWAEDYRRVLTAENIFDIQTELASAIIGELQARLTPMEQARVDRVPTHDLDAYRLAIEARRSLDELTEDGMRKAADLFRQSLDHDPSYALAWVGLADSYALLYDYRFDRDALVPAQAEAAARKALEIDPTSAEAFASLGLVQGSLYQGPDAIRSLTTAVQLRPNFADAYSWRAFYYNGLGMPGEALESALHGVALDPHSGEIVSNTCLSYITAGQFQNAVEICGRLRVLLPEWPTTRFYEALALFHLGGYGDARALLTDTTVDWAGSGAESLYGLMLIGDGDNDSARQVAETLENERALFDAALVYAGLGDTDRAFALLQENEDWGHWPAIALHNLYPDILAAVRADARYDDIMGRVADFWQASH